MSFSDFYLSVSKKLGVGILSQWLALWNELHVTFNAEIYDYAFTFLWSSYDIPGYFMVFSLLKWASFQITFSSWVHILSFLVNSIICFCFFFSNSSFCFWQPCISFIGCYSLSVDSSVCCRLGVSKCSVRSRLCRLHIVCVTYSFFLKKCWKL